MNNPFELQSFDEVLDAYLSASKVPNREALTDWIRRFPEYEKELIDFTIAWSETEHLPAVQQAGLEGHAFVAIGMRLAHEAFDSERREYTETKLPMVSILDEGKSQGITPDQLSDQLKLSIIMIRKIDLRNILFSSIPLNLLESLSQAIKRSVREVARYLSGQSVIPETVRFKSSQPPKVAAQKNFFDEIRRDAMLDKEQRDYWLSYEEKELVGVGQR